MTWIVAVLVLAMLLRLDPMIGMCEMIFLLYVSDMLPHARTGESEAL